MKSPSHYKWTSHAMTSQRFRVVVACVGAIVHCVSIAEVRADSYNFVNVDGQLGDWGATLKDGSTSSNVPTEWSHSKWVVSHSLGTNISGEATRSNGFTFKYNIEDQNDRAGHEVVIGPNRGGQDYDAEFMGVGFDGSHLVIAIATGQRPDNDFKFYAPGDIYISTSAGTFGVEVGGYKSEMEARRANGENGYDGGDVSGSIVEGDPGTTFAVDSGGFTTGILLSNYPSSGSSSNNGKYGDGTGIYEANPQQTAGSVWHNPTWFNDPIANPLTPVQMQFTGGQRVGEADYIYTRNATLLGSGGTSFKHAVIEVAIPLAFFGGATIGVVQWSPACGNDILQVWVTPEPSSLALALMGGLFGFAHLRRRSRRMRATA